jgi:hypothetical protein
MYSVNLRDAALITDEPTDILGGQETFLLRAHGGVYRYRTPNE